MVTVHQLRPIDIWFIENILPHEPAYLARANRLARNDREGRDLVHEAYSKLMQIDGWQAIENPRAYVMQMLQNLALQDMRRARIVRFEQLAEAGMACPADTAPDAFRVVSGMQRVELLQQALAHLPERNRQAVILRRVEGLSPRAAAAKLGLSLSTFEKRLARGLTLLAMALEGQPGQTAIATPGTESQIPDKAASERRQA